MEKIMELKGVWLPVVTPFINNEVDYESYRRLINFYIDKKISGIIPFGTTGESPAIEDDEFFKILETTIETVDKRIPIYFGVGGNYTDKVIRQINKIEKYDFEGILSVSPYFSRPGQAGIFEHFKKISNNTDKNIIVYNIPYRTGRNIENETIYKLATLRNITGIKDSCGDIKQSMELLLNKPDNFSVFTGEDLMFYITLTLGGDGGILAAAHIDTEKYINIYKLVKSNDHQSAAKYWKELSELIPLLFNEPNPSPVKYMLKRMNLISSSETRLPLTDISENLKVQLDRYIKK